MRTALALLLFVTTFAAQAASYQWKSDHHAISIDVVPITGGDQFNVTIVDVATGATLASPHLVAASGTQAEWTDDTGERRIHLVLRATGQDLIATAELSKGDTMEERIQTTWSTGPRHVMDLSSDLRVSGDVKAPRLIHRVEPVYPEEARKARITGVVIVKAVITREGKVKDAVVLKPVPMLNDAALAAVKQWTFEPGTLNGQPVDVVFDLAVNFSLTPKPADH
ncbi:MAG TPA: energy transducer TonB [Thermoanaerobaculia bacterium]|jgi:TonB family protein|nr:energy transducer TonB [Thermoanaerobaculia bacterium]